MEETNNSTEKKVLTLKDLATPNDEIKKASTKVADTSELKPIDINTIAPKKPEYDVNEVPVVKAYKELDDAIERKKKETEDRIQKAKKEILEAKIEESIKNDTLGENTKQKVEKENLDELFDDQLDSLLNDEEAKVPTNVKEAINVANEQPKTEKSIRVNTEPVVMDLPNSEENFLDEESDEEEDILDDSNKEKEEAEMKAKREKAFEEYKKKVKECISPMYTGKKFDLSKFKIRRKPVTYSKLLAERAFNNSDNKSNSHISTWILPNSDRTITLSEFKGTDLDSLSTDEENLNSLQRLTRFYSTIYRHVVDPNKPKTLETWLKSISLLDVGHLNFAVYKASFEQSNYVTEICNNKKCLSMDLVKHPIMDMVTFKDEETKKKYMDIFNKKENTTPSTLEETPVQINDKYVFGLRFPSIYHSLFESTQISRNVAIKHQALLANMAFINSIYAINEETEELIPIDFKPDANSFKTTVENKFKIIVRVLKELSPDEFAYLQSAIINLSNSQFENPGDITYGYPESKCSKCGATIPATPQSNPISMVFTRLQLTQESN